jgi:hypothetical protein
MKKEDRTIVDAEQHVLYCGVTMTGKTTLARHHAQILDRSDYDIVVYDPVGTPTANGDWPEQAKIIREQAEFHKWIASAKGESDRPIFLFVDEGADIFGHGNGEAFWIPRKCRHQNIYLRIMVQRPKMLHPSVRTQCALCYMFRLSRDDAREVAGDFGHGPELLQQDTLDTGDCILLTSGTEAIERFNVFELTGHKRP